MSVPVAPSPERLIRFDTFEVDVRTGELRKQGVRVRLAEQPFSVLALLLAQAGEVVTLDELQQKLWPRDTFVDFDRGLNKAINRLRDALGDSADAPRFIETLPKRGYRFIGSTVPSSPTTGDPAKPRPARKRPWLPLAGAFALALATILLTWRWTTERAPPASAEPLIRSSLLPPKDRVFVPYSMALSRDGSHLAFVAEAADGSRSLWIRAMATTTATPIAGTDGASFPFWSPEARQIGFFADRKLKVAEVVGGAIRIVADARRPSGGAWNRDDVIVFAPDVNGALYRVSAAGGTPSAVTGVPESDDFYGHRWPVFLPDSNHFLYVALSAAARSDNSPELHIGSLDSIESTRIEWDGARSGDVRAGPPALRARRHAVRAALQQHGTTRYRSSGSNRCCRFGRDACVLSIAARGLSQRRSGLSIVCRRVVADDLARPAWTRADSAAGYGIRCAGLLARRPAAGWIVRGCARRHIIDLRARPRARCRESNHRGSARSISRVVARWRGDRILLRRRHLLNAGGWFGITRARIATGYSDELVTGRADPFFRQSARRSVARALVATDERGAGTWDRRRRPIHRRWRMARLPRSGRARRSAISREKGSCNGCGRRRRATALERGRQTALLRQRGQEIDGCRLRSRRRHGERTSPAGANANRGCCIRWAPVRRSTRWPVHH